MKPNPTSTSAFNTSSQIPTSYSRSLMDSEIKRSSSKSNISQDKLSQQELIKRFDFDS